MSNAPKDLRSAAEKARDTAGILGSLMHEGYVSTPEAEAIHGRAQRGEITTEELIEDLPRAGGCDAGAPILKVRLPNLFTRHPGSAIQTTPGPRGG
jgi:hypothetical protein